jgi:hypothetical protein
MKKTSLLMFALLAGFSLISFASGENGEQGMGSSSSLVNESSGSENGSSKNTSVLPGIRKGCDKFTKPCCKFVKKTFEVVKNNKYVTSGLVAVTGVTVVDGIKRIKKGEMPIVDRESRDKRDPSHEKFGHFDFDIFGSAGINVWSKTVSVKHWRTACVTTLVLLAKTFVDKYK